MATRALVVGGTNGIGYAIACRLAADHPDSTVIISGRTEPKNIPHPNIQFRRLDASSMKAISGYAEQFKSVREEWDMLVLSQGILTTAGRAETAEGIDNKMALHFYGRQLLIRELTPALKRDGKVLVVLDGERGDPAKLIWDDLDLKTHFSIANAAAHCISMTDAMVQRYAAQQKELGTQRHFVHALPGFVNTNIAANLPWYLKTPTRVLSSVLATTPEACAEHMLKGTYDCAAAGARDGKLWSCINAKGQVVQNKPKWTQDQLDKVEAHTWKIVDGALAA
ncbi:uncharacterized protein E0L32_003162 [Thyridium curvatum]|uniref:Uncharacterized protein n=1 Tax=Thyridium curvatum TaxID=1093900 RepID=A0A507BJA4_9PEZI|nr:uncharacterized protein E0L32_003162 [Thyridium curvatum]TPX17519.1 hypothetical protein E0L32_003162 [Thyridium curvatum]